MFPGVKAHLMVFRDGVTIVFHAMDLHTFLDRYNGKSANKNAWFGDTFQKILDKDHILPEIERSEEKQTIFESAPGREEFSDINNEFWWVMKTFAEYTLREELLSSMFYLNNAVRNLLNRMLRWYICLKAGHPTDIRVGDVGVYPGSERAKKERRTEGILTAEFTASGFFLFRGRRRPDRQKNDGLLFPNDSEAFFVSLFASLFAAFLRLF